MGNLIKATAGLRENKVKELVNFINASSEKGEAVNISRAAFITALNILSNLLFSVDICNYDSENSNEFQDTVADIMKAVGSPDIANYFPILSSLDLQGNSKTMNVCKERLFRVFRKIIHAKQEEKVSRENPKDVSDRDFVDVLLDLIDKDEAKPPAKPVVKLDINDIEHLIWDLFTAGVDTSSITVEWAMAELLRNPDMMTDAQAEINDKIGQKDAVQESVLSELKYLGAVVKETFRLHPPLPLLIPRKAESDTEVSKYVRVSENGKDFKYVVSKDKKDSKYVVPKDTQVLVNVWAIGQDENVWKNPTTFDPERFKDKKIGVRGSHYQLTPFGSGRKMCPGMPLALKTVPLMLASLLFYFDWKLPNGIVSNNMDMDESFGLTLHKTNPLHAVPVKKRSIN